MMPMQQLQMPTSEASPLQGYSTLAQALMLGLKQRQQQGQQQMAQGQGQPGSTGGGLLSSAMNGPSGMGSSQGLLGGAGPLFGSGGLFGSAQQDYSAPVGPTVGGSPMPASVQTSPQTGGGMFNSSFLKNLFSS